MKYIHHTLKVGCQNSELFLKQNTVFIDDAHKNANFVHVKTTYCSHRLLNFWDTKPVIHEMCG